MTDDQISTEGASPAVVGPNSIVAKNGETVAKMERIVRFRGRPMILDYTRFPHFVPLHKERFDKIAYPILGGVSRSRINDVYSYLANTAEDLSDNEHLIGFGYIDDDMELTDDGRLKLADNMLPPTVWDMDALEMNTGLPIDYTVWRSPYSKVLPNKDAESNSLPIPFIMSLAGGDQGLYDDIMQSLAPIVMKRKPDGVIWWVGDGANGKSTLMDAIYRIFPGQLSSITVKRLVDGRDTPSLNGTLANVVKESSEGRIDDTEIYKSIGTHENFRVHKFHSQDDIEVRGNVHHIFSANSIPTFNDKGYSARRRTFIIPFTQRFESDPEFEEKTFTPELFGQIITEMCKYAIRLKRQGYRYKWSAKTLAAKLEYDKEANNAEEFAKELIGQGVIAFDSYNVVRIDYENWCADNGYVPLGIGNLRKALTALGFDRSSRRENDHVTKFYRLQAYPDAELQRFGLGRPGLYTTYGFTPNERSTDEEAEKPEVKKQTTILNGKW